MKTKPSRRELIDALKTALLGLQDEFYAYAAIATIKNVLLRTKQ